LTKEEEHPTSTKYLSPTFLILERCVWENQVEYIADETETLMLSAISLQRIFVSISSIIKRTKLRVK
jgi:hypothetical protein